MPLLAMPDRLSPLGPVRRALVSLGGATAPDLEPLRRTGPAENEEELLPDGWTLRLGPITTGRDGTFLAGFVAISLGVTGYPFAWRPRDLVRRAESIDSVRARGATVRTVVAGGAGGGKRGGAGRPPPAARRTLGPYWPYEHVDRPLDWSWGFAGVA